jgi:GxxExxY protein
MPEQIPSLPEALNKLSGTVVDSALTVHKALGPGLLESVYETCLAHELRLRGLNVQSQIFVPILYKGLEFESGLRLDMLVEKQLVVEIKAIEQVLKVHEAQLLTYLKLTNCRLGLLINFNVPILKAGITRIVL